MAEVLVAGTARIPPERMAEFRLAARTVIEATRHEDGCIAYAFAEDVLEPGLIHMAERWRDREALRAHGDTPHVAAWRLVLKDLGAHDRNIIAYPIDQAEPI